MKDGYYWVKYDGRLTIVWLGARLVARSYKDERD